MTDQEIKTAIETTLNTYLPANTFTMVQERKQPLSNENTLRIVIAACEQSTGCATGNRPQQVSLCLELNSLDLYVQVYGGTGGQNLTVKAENKHLYCSRVRVPFRTPKKELKNVLMAISRFAQNWIKLIEQNKDNLLYSDIVDYNKLINS